MQTKLINIQNLVKPSVRSLRAYEAKETPCRAKLDANESPYAFEGDLSRILKDLKTNRYPDPEAKALKKIVARRFGVTSENILFGNGSDELIGCIVTTFGGPVLYPTPTFSMYGIISRALGEATIEIPLDREFDIDIKRTIAAIKEQRPKIIFLSSPNNPTGNCFSSDSILKITDSSFSARRPSLVVVDEAYQPFSSERGFLSLLKDYRNLIIMRTLSKIGLAALRLGFMIADPEIISEVNKVRLPFNLNSVSQAIAAEALKQRRGLDSAVKKISFERELLFRELVKIKGIWPFPSEANFILFRTGNPKNTYKALLERDVLVRDMSDAVPGCLRVTVGTPEENRLFLNALKSISK